MSEEDENKDESGNVDSGNVVLTGYNVGGAEACTFDNGGFQPETHDITHDKGKN